MKDTRYQFAPRHVRIYRWLRWKPLYTARALRTLTVWVLCGAKIPAEEADWFRTRRAYAAHLWTCYDSLAAYSMGRWHIIDEILSKLKEGK